MIRAGEFKDVKKMIAGAGKAKTHLLIVIGAATILWGVISANYFGITPGSFEPGSGIRNIMIALAPLVMTGAMGTISGAVAGAGMVVSLSPGRHSALMGGAMTAVGAVGAGMGPGGIVAGGTSYSLGKAYTGAMSQRTRAPPPPPPPPQSTSRPPQQEPPEDGSGEFT